MDKKQKLPIRGGIYYVIRETEKPLGHEQWAQRPGIVVSDVRRNTCMVVYLTTGTALPDPDKVHVKITSAAKPSTALCDQIKTVDVRYLGKCFGRITEDEERRITAACRRALHIPEVETITMKLTPGENALAAELAEAKKDAAAWQRVALHMMEK